MKKVFIIISIFILVSYYLAEADAAEIFNVEFSQGDQRGYILKDGDGISFSFSGKGYVISVDEIGKKSARLKSFIYRENNEKETFYLPLSKGVSYKIDFNKDEVYDMRVSLIEIDNNEKKATFLFEAIQEAKKPNETNEISGSATARTASNLGINYKGLIITALIIIAGLVAYFTFRK